MSSFESEQDPAETDVNDAAEADVPTSPVTSPVTTPEAVATSAGSGNGKIVTIVVAAVVIIAVAIAAGLYFGGVFKSPDDSPKTVVQKFVTSDTCAKVQALMTEAQYAENFSQTPCTDAAIKASFAMIQLSDLKTTTKDNVAFVKGTATVTDPTTKQSNKSAITVNLINIDNHWLVDHLYAGPK